MKKLSILLSFMLLCLTTNSENTIQLSSSYIISVEKDSKIDLSGNFPSTGARSALEPIILIQHLVSLEAAFSYNLGMITIEIRNENNSIIYHDIIDTNHQKYYEISLFEYKSGSYHIEFTNSQGQYVQGTFEIEK